MSAVTPWPVGPPLTPGRATKHGGVYTDGILSRPVLRSHIEPQSYFSVVPAFLASSQLIGRFVSFSAPLPLDPSPATVWPESLLRPVDDRTATSAIAASTASNGPKRFSALGRGTGVV